jgi:PadR family transcriptional regulator PadR
MVLKTLNVLGPLHGYAIARRIEQISGDLLAVNQGTLYPVLLKLEQEGAIASEWGASDNNRHARFYRLARGGHKLLQAETRDWEQTTAILSRFFGVEGGGFVVRQLRRVLDSCGQLRQPARRPAACGDGRAFSPADGRVCSRRHVPRRSAPPSGAEVWIPEAVREKYYAELGLPLLEKLMRDTRYAARLLASSPGFTVAA